MTAADRPRVGDQITTADQLDALPAGAVLRDHLTGAVGVVLDAPDEHGLYRVEFAGIGNTRVDRLVVLYVPGDRPPVTDNTRAALLGTDTEEGALDLDRPAGDGTPYFEGIVEGYNRAVEVVIATLDRLAAGRAETATATHEDAAQLATARTRPTREQIIEAIGHDGEWCKPERGPERCCDAPKLADAVLALLADQPDAADVWDQAVEKIREQHPVCEDPCEMCAEMDDWLTALADNPYRGGGDQ